MYVKGLKLAGFKSFADPTLLEFEPGVNVIVGPNGSGKSNIADAISWVLGSQAPSSLRGGSMEDVIFAGSQSRPGLGLAEVEVTFDNASRLLPLDLNEVTVTRINDRSGTSEYRINGAPCRLLDVTELLSDTGIGRSLHTVVGQGQLDAVLHARPEERRTFIEEAAQIGKYRRRKDRSLRKIERVEDNLLRLGDVLAELRRAARPLKRQATAAAAYSELVAEHTGTKQRLTATEIEALIRDDAAVDPDAEAHRTRLLADELDGVRARLETAARARSGLQTAAEKARDVAHRMSRATDRLAGLERLAGERARTISARLAAETEEGYRERIRLLESERTRWRKESATLEGAGRRARTTADDAGATASSSVAAREEAERALSRARANETTAVQALVRAEGSEAAGRATLGSIEARVHAVIQRRDVAAGEVRESTTAIARAESEVEALEAELDARTARASESEDRLAASRRLLDDMRDRSGNSRADVAAADARLATLNEVASLFSGRPDVVERIRPLIEEAAHRRRLVTEAEQETARQTAEARTGVGRREADVAAHDEELRRLDALVAAAADRLAGARRRLEAKEIEVAALDDELVRAQDALATARRSSSEERAALPARRVAAEEAAEERVRCESTLADVRAAETAASAAATGAEIAARAAEERVLAARLRLEEAESGIADAQAALEGLEDLRSRLGEARRTALAVASAAALGAERGTVWAVRAEAGAKAAHDRAEAEDRRLSDLRARERELSNRLEEAARLRTEAEVRRARNRARLEAIGERTMDEWGLTVAGVAALDAYDGEDEVAAARARLEALEREMRRLGPVNPRAAEEYEELSTRERFLIEQIDDLKRSRRDLLSVVKEVDDTIVEVFGDAYRAVAAEFEDVFGRLFPGGSGRLTLTDPNDLLGSGIDVEARPPGKNVRKLSLLSGGERSLVALAFLLAIFRARPSPFYLLDEVEAALDDINLQRFLRLIEELEERAQVMIVTHQKRTMEAADVLYGVSMGREGVSRVVAKRMAEVSV
jgi:chromosome segregation protein